MLILYTNQDLRGQNVLKKESLIPVNWYDDVIVAATHQRKSMTQKVRDCAQAYGDGSGKGTVNHFVPWSRIMGQLIVVLTTMGENGKGMTRRRSVNYLKWVLAELGMVSFDPDYWIPDPDIFIPNGTTAPKSDPEDNRLSYDRWVSWAVDIICDWPKNLFQGESAGDGGGYQLDMPVVNDDTHAMRNRLWEASLWLKLAIPGLKLSYKHNEPEHGWALQVDLLWATGPPMHSRTGQVWEAVRISLPYYTRKPMAGEDEDKYAGPDFLHKDLYEYGGNDMLKAHIKGERSKVIEEDKTNQIWGYK